jgi:hypothetical protein
MIARLATLGFLALVGSATLAAAALGCSARLASEPTSLRSITRAVPASNSRTVAGSTCSFRIPAAAGGKRLIAVASATVRVRLGATSQVLAIDGRPTRWTIER